jgi:hypothetical protein
MTPGEWFALAGAILLMAGAILLTASAVDSWLARRERRARERAVDAFLAGYWRDVPDERGDR